MIEKLPKVAYSSEIKIGDMTLKVHVLDDGRKIIEEESLVQFFGFLSKPASTHNDKDFEELAKFIKKN